MKCEMNSPIYIGDGKIVGCCRKQKLFKKNVKMDSEDPMKDNFSLRSKCSKFFTSSWTDLDLALIEKANQNRNQYSHFTDEQQRHLLKSITHVMDCECFVIDECVFYREISLCDLNKKKVQTYFYDSSFPQFHELNEKQQ